MIRRATTGQQIDELDALTARLVSLRAGGGRYADARRLAERMLAEETSRPDRRTSEPEEELALSKE